jgi:anti-sigma B factor antagonist
MMGRSRLDIRRREDDRGIVLALRGELDLATGPDLERQLVDIDGAVAQGRLLIDLTGLEFMDSTGLALLVRAQRSAKANAHDLSLRVGTSQVRRVLEVAGVLGRFTVESS